MADATELSIVTIIGLRENKCCEIEMDALTRLCYVLDCKIDDLLKYDIEK